MTATSRHLPIAAAAAAVALLAGLPVVTPAARAAGHCDPPVVNPIACENSLPGSPSSEWSIDGNGDDTIQGFATDMSVNKGQTVRFKIKTGARAYRLDIYRMGYYGGDGARKVATVNPSAALPQSQPACIDQSSTTGLVDCGNWAESASWAVPATAVSGIYFAHLVRTDNGGGSHIVFVVRDDASSSAALFQTSDTTWQAYNSYGGNSLYLGAPAGRAYKVSYNRPFNTRGTTPWGRDFVWANEYPMVRWMEANGYDVTYTTGVDSDRRGALIKNHKVFLSVGHDEYWSGQQRAHVEAARDAGVHLAFFSGNSVYWKTRWESSVDGSGTSHRTLVSYKETKANAQIDPLGPSMWTGTWRDPRFSPPGDGGRPENQLMGTLFQVNSGTAAIKVPEADGKMRLWRNTSVASLGAGATATLAAETLGYEWDEDRDNGFRPGGLFHLSTTTENVPEYLLDYGNTVGPATATHHLTMYRAPSGALVFGAGTIQWSWGLDSDHDGTAVPPDTRMRQATVNLLADMGMQPATLQAGLALAAKSTDSTAPTATITSPAAGAVLNNTSTVTVTGTASDTGGQVAAVEVSLDGGTTWRPASGRTSWSYPLPSTGAGTVTIKARAVDDSGNIQPSPATVSVTIECPCQIFSNSSVPVTPSANDTAAVELGVKFRSDVDAYVTGIRFYKGTGNTGTHTGSLWTSTGTRLASATFNGETASGWQQVSFAAPILIAANTTYVASYYAPNGRYAADTSYFAAAGVDSPPLHALRAGVDGENGVYRYGTGGGFPTNSYRNENYWVDVVVTTNTGPDTTPPVITATAPAAGTNGNATTTPVRATFSESVQPSSVSLVVRDAANAAIPGSVAYDAPSRTATFTASAPLAGSTTFTATVSGAQDAAGNVMAPHAWSFTTAAPPGTCPCSIWTSSAVPATAAEADPGAVELGVKFRADVAGYITGIRFYKGPGNGGTHVGNLWTTSGTRLATATFTNESDTGWQQVTFATPVAVAANTTYVASYHAPLGYYAANGGYFAGGGADSPPLRALASGVEGSNGVYAYGPGGFPSQSYNNTNYWVDVVFVTSLAPPTTTTTTTTVPVTTTTTSVPPTTTTTTAVGPTTTTSVSPTTTTTTVPVTTTTTSVPPTTTTVAPTTTTTTTLPAPRSFTDTSTADFAGGTFSNGATAVETGDGEVSLKPVVGSEFSGSSLPSGWTSTTLATGGSSTVSGGALIVTGASAGTTSTYGRDRSLEFVATFTGAANESAGFGVDAATNEWAMFGTSTDNALYARSRAGASAADTPLTGVALGVPHLFRIDWDRSGVVYSVNGVVRATHAVSSSASLRLLVADGATTDGAVVVDWMRMTPYSTNGNYTSKVFDAGASGPWGTASWVATLPAGTTVTVRVRTGNTATPGSGWTSWRTLSGSGASIAATSRYIQYRVIFSTSSNRESPALRDITLRWRT